MVAIPSPDVVINLLASLGQLLAFVSILVPLLVFFFMQKYLVRGLLAGSVK